jgi:SAM-dependent methyltransferase
MTKEKDYLWENISDLPYFRGFLRAVEAKVYQEIDLQDPVLDLGCGDGQFVTTAFDHKLDVGLDPWTEPIHEATSHGGYHSVVQADAAKMPFEDAYFGSAISNSVLEHIPHLDSVLQEAARVLRPGALFVFCVPNHQFLSNLSVSNFFDKIGLKKLANAYRRFFNKISRHHHCDSPEIWEKRLNAAGFEIEKYWHYFSPKALRTLEWGHYFGLPSLITRKLFGKWILVKKPWNLVLTRALVQPFFEEEREQELGAYSFYITRRIA